MTPVREPWWSSSLPVLLESAGEAIIGEGPDASIRFWNPAAERLFGLLAAEAIGLPISAVLPHRGTLEANPLSHQRPGTSHPASETSGRRKDGSPVPIALRLVPIRGEDGAVLGRWAIARDLSEQKHTDEFLATLSHELRTPVNAILGYVQMLRTGAVSEDRRGAALATIERNATSVSRIVDDLLDFSRAVSQEIRLELRRVNLANLSREAVDSILPVAAAKGVVLTCECDEPMWIRGDPKRVQQVLSNVLTNGVKFTGPAGRVELTLRRVGDRVDVVIADTGIGIAPEFLPYVFDRYRQAESGPAREGSGLGLGLAIARHLAELHGGSIEAASEGTGLGATFTVRFPTA